MKKRVFILALLMLLSAVCLSSCKQETAYETYTNAYNKTVSLTDFDMTVDGEVKISTCGVTYTMPINGVIKMIKDDEEKSIMMDMTMATSIMDMEMTIGIIYDGEWAYINTVGTKSKKQLTYDKIEEVLANRKKVELSESDFEGVEFTKENGRKSATLTISGDTLKNSMLEALSSKMNDNGNEFWENLTMDDIELTPFINEEGYLDETDIKGAASFSADLVGTGAETEVSVVFDFSVTYNNIGEPVSISAPEDADDYTVAESAEDFSGILG